jgi:hypothetical protein
MAEVSYTLVAEGPGDSALLPIIDWTLEQNSSVVFQPQHPDLRRFEKPQRGLSGRIQAANDLAPCDLLFVHRDADRERRDKRVQEVLHALESLHAKSAVCIIPVRMTEAWLLFNESAIRRAAGNLDGKTALGLPKLARLESVSNPKDVLQTALRTATGHHGRRLRRWRSGPAVQRLARLIGDFSPLRRLTAFAEFERELRDVLKQNDWLG